MSLTRHEIAALVAEAAPGVRGGRIERVFHPLDDRLVLVLRVPTSQGPTETRRLLLCFHRRHPRVVLADETPQNPETPSPFCMALRHHLEGARLDEIAAVAGERAVTLAFSARDESGAARRLRLVAELFGRGGNLLLVDEADTIVAVLRPTTSGVRPFAPGATYVPAARPGTLPDEPAEAAPLPAPTPENPFPLNRAVEQRLAEQETREAFEEKRTSRLRDAERRLATAERKAVMLAGEFERFQKPERFLEQGELLKANLTRLGGADVRGRHEAVVQDFFRPDAPEVTLVLDPKQSLRENMESAFKKYRKALSGREKIERHRARTSREIDEARRQLDSLRAAETLDALESIAPPPRGRTAQPRRREEPAEREPKGEPGLRRFTSEDGLEILVGKGDEENDRLTFRIANGNDLWLHVRDFPGSHVVVRLPKGKAPPQETLLDAAHLAAFFSQCRDRPIVEVAYTQRKNVAKPRGAKPGLVTLGQHKSIRLRIERARLDRLLGREHPTE
ncbi:MAG: NFACT family protein [Planctomycetes bacterium]|nr:NFACT family protein [Planctomycetota bacterium]MBI3846781.1 NFACT family protein [Planctomycetota bacterium]